LHSGRRGEKERRKGRKKGFRCGAVCRQEISGVCPKGDLQILGGKKEEGRKKKEGGKERGGCVRLDVLFEQMPLGHYKKRREEKRKRKKSGMA